MVGIKGEFDVFNKHIGILKVGPFRGTADIAQIGRSIGDKSDHISYSIKRVIFYLRIVESEGGRGYF